MRRLLFALMAMSVTATLVSSSCVNPLPAAGSGIGGEFPDAGFYDAPDQVPGELCTNPLADQVKFRFEPSTVFLAPCVNEPCPSHQVKLILTPDICFETQVDFTTQDPSVARVPLVTPDVLCSYDTTNFCVGLNKASVPVNIQAGPNSGTTSIAASMLIPTGYVLNDTADADLPTNLMKVTGSLKVVVLDPKIEACSGTASTASLSGGDTLLGKGGLAGASIALPAGATAPNDDGYVWHVDPFPATINCAKDIVPPGYIALGPAITFGPDALRFQREIPVSIPINPAAIPPKARMRHVRVAYSGPAAKAPRTAPVADTHIQQVGGDWALSYKIPRLGTYQAVIAADAGTHSFTRRLTHRAIVGFSMGGGGTAMMGFRHHDLFDVIAPLGGPVDWTWELNYIENNHLGGFRPIAKGTTLAQIQLAATPCMSNTDCKSDETCMGIFGECAMAMGTKCKLDTDCTAGDTCLYAGGKCALLPTPTEPYQHTQTYNFWWYEYPSTGNGGTFSRQEYAQIFRDLGIMFGNPNGENLSPNAQNLPAGVPPTDKSVLGDHPGTECKIAVDPVDCPTPSSPPTAADKQCAATNMAQGVLQSECAAERCSHTLTLQNYFDDEYNPDGTFPVITVCDGGPQNQGSTPWSNEWIAGNETYPLEVALAVDYNGNGVRDELEPIIRAGHEKWYDDGTDHTPSSLEPGYKKGVNDDPNGDDYDAQYNPTGTEGDHRFEPGEKFDDYGLDGVKGTKQQPATGWAKPGDGYDVGEGDGKFTVSSGLQSFWDRDPHSIIRNMVDPSKIPAGELTDDALKRLDVWTDGGDRDLFNFNVDAQHLVGALYARGRDAQYMTDFNDAPGLDPTQQSSYNPKNIIFEDLPGVVFQRYGVIDQTPASLAEGSGQHVGTPEELLGRVESALFFIGSRWLEPELRVQSSRSGDNPIPGASMCEVSGECSFNFTSQNGRTGPVVISLPPGYANINNAELRYPVIFFLHGYGQDPSGLAAVEALFPNLMNDPADSIATRLPKAIVVYVDGRCRVTNGKPECIEGTFFTNSVMSQGAQDEQWWLELIDHVDQNFRTMGETDVDWTE